MRHARLTRISGVLAIALIPILSTTSRAREPATRPTSAGEAPPAVLVLPFEPLSADTPQDTALARAVQRSLVLDLSRARAIHVLDSEKVAPDRAAAVAAGRDSNAAFVVWGTVQFVEGRLRITGEVLDASHDAPGDDFKLTGTLKELFEMQDLVTEQVMRRLPRAASSDDGEAPPRRPNDAGAADDHRDAPREAPAGAPLTRQTHKLDPDWLHADPDAVTLDDGVTHRYRYGQEPSWSAPYAGGYHGRYPFGPAYGGYHPSYYRPYRPLHQHRYTDYTYRGLPDRRPHYGFGPRHVRSFSGPVPLRWYDHD